ncbi:MAG: TonB-dependent receptor [Candidatus Marinimicrobia bacterium]|nr:TonB-dependent receptor [Candidatus Neomarinimicrobiota bacterium]MCF7903786.1 TonB-dependent receptor [Candidatus Neomarinimicrobiota bacterium]
MKKITTITILFFLFSQSLVAGVGGKLAGTVRDENGSPLIGVNIIINDTPLGTASREDGSYFIINIPPGTYTIRFQMIGYKVSVHENVQVVSDFTTRVSTQLEPVSLDATEEVVVVATRPLIQRDATATIRVVQADDIVAMPVDNITDVLATQAGFTTDDEGGLHVRGGRSKEILYMIDGVVVKDPMEGDFSGSVNQNAIQELTVISGTFNAEYGQAMSSVVNIVTKEGSREFHGRMEYTSDQLNAYQYHKAGAFAYLDTAYANEDSNYVYVDLADSLLLYYNTAPAGLYPETFLPLLDLPLNGQLSLNLGGPLFGKTSYYLSTLYGKQKSPLAHGAEIDQDVHLKLSNRITSKLKLTASAQSSSRLYQRYSHPWKYLPQNQAHTFKSNDRVSLSLTQALSEALFYNLHLSSQTVSTKTSVKTLSYTDYERPITNQSVYFYKSGTQGTFIDNSSKTQTLNWNLTYNTNYNHMIKTGLTASFHELDVFAVEDPWVGGTNFKDDTTFTPNEFSMYIQDKIEFEYLIFNLGLRYDRIDPNIGMWEDVARFAVWDSTLQTWVPAPVVDTPAEAKLSPRIGIAYPVTENTVFHFSYGHFFQSPDFNSMTYNADKDITTALPLVGNAGVKPQKTVAFEVGVKQALSPITRLTATVWSKDIRDLLSTQQYRIISIPVVVYANSDYASVKGVDLSIDRQFGGLFSANLSYSLSVARGNNSSPVGGYFSAYTNEEVPHKEYYLSFDQRHDLACNLNFRTKAKSGLTLFGMDPLANVNANLLLNVASGLPYTPYVDPTIRVEINSARKPWTYSLDLRVKKQVKIGSVKPALFLEAMNITDHDNVLSVNNRTGKPFDQGLSGLVSGGEDSNLNPAKLGPGRSIKLGFSVGW